MEIRGIIKSKHVDQIRLITTEKNQEIDVFYTESKKFDVEEISENEQVIFDVRIQSTDYYGLKLGKFWLSDIIYPKRKFLYKPERGKGEGDGNWAERRRNENL